MEGLDKGYKKIKIEAFDEVFGSKVGARKNANSLLPSGLGNFFSQQQVVNKFKHYNKSIEKTDKGSKKNPNTNSTKKNPNNSSKKNRKSTPKNDFLVKTEYMDRFSDYDVFPPFNPRPHSNSPSLSQVGDPLQEDPMPTTFFASDPDQVNTILIVGKDGSLLRCCPDDQFQSLDYGYIHTGNIMSLVVTPDKEYIFTGGEHFFYTIFF
jgi:hypothetical protein